MSAQTTYKYSTPIGAAGGIVDLAPYVIDTFANEENTGDMKFGLGVVKGTTAGKEVKIPTGTNVSADFEGIVTNRRTTEYDLEGAANLRKNAALGIMRHGRIYGRIADSVSPAYGGQVYLLISGTQAGYFTTSSANAIKINARFLGAVDATNRVAEIELFDGPLAPEYTLPAASADDLGGVKVGTGLEIADGVLSVSSGT